MFTPDQEMDQIAKDMISKSELGAALKGEEFHLSDFQRFMYLKMSGYKGQKVELVRLLFTNGAVESGLVFFEGDCHEIYEKIKWRLIQENGDPERDVFNCTTWYFDKGNMELVCSEKTPWSTPLPKQYIYMSFIKL